MAKYAAKTTPTAVSFTAYLIGIDDPERRKDCKALAALMKRVTGCTPRLWGTSIVGFDTYHYKYASGHEGDACVVGFASRKNDLTLYLAPGYEEAGTRALLARLGKHKAGQGCLHVKRLADVDMAALEALVTKAVTETKRKYPGVGA